MPRLPASPDGRPVGGRGVAAGVAVLRVVVAAAVPPSFRVRPLGAAGGASAAAAGEGAAETGVTDRLTGFLTSTVTARVRPWLNFWRTCVSPPLAAAAPVRAVVVRVSGLVGLVCSFCSVIRLLSLLRFGPSTGAVQAIEAPARRSARNPLNELARRIVARHRYVDRLLASEDTSE